MASPWLPILLLTSFLECIHMDLSPRLAVLCWCALPLWFPSAASRPSRSRPVSASAGRLASVGTANLAPSPQASAVACYAAARDRSCSAIPVARSRKRLRASVHRVGRSAMPAIPASQPPRAGSRHAASAPAWMVPDRWARLSWVRLLAITGIIASKNARSSSTDWEAARC